MKKGLKVLSMMLLLTGIVSCGGKTSSSVVPQSSTPASSETSSSKVSSSEATSSSDTSSSQASSSDTSSSQTSSSSSVVSSSSEDKIVTRISEFVASNLATATLSGESYEIDSVFSIIGSNVTYDAGSGKEVTNISGTSVSSGGRLKNFKQKGTGTYLQVKVTGDNAKLLLQIAPGGKGERSLTILNSEGTSIYSKSNGGTSSDMFAVNLALEKGTYTIGGTNGYNLYYAGLKEDVKEGKEVDFRVDADNVDKNLFVGEALNLSSLHVYKVFDNDTEIELTSSDYTIDQSKLNINAAGDYTIDVKYKNYDAKKIAINVSEITSIEVNDLLITSGGKNANRVSKVYKLNDTINTDAFTIIGKSEKTSKVITPDSIVLPDTTTTGTKDIVIKKNNLTHAYPISVIDSSTIPTDANNRYYYFAVNKSYVDGTIVKNREDENAMGFNSIQKALDFIKTSGLSDEITKYIDIAEGTYDEKIYVESKKVFMLGSSTGETIIEHAAINDTTDARGTKYSTYGSAAVTVHADTFGAYDITFKNSYFETMDEYNQCKLANKQGVAFVCDNDAVISHCNFIGFQDTLYARLGNQLYSSCNIQGMTDYIFGESANALFEGCTITTLNRGSETNNGYIATTKPGSEVTGNNFGFLFNNCAITSEKDANGNSLVPAGTVSLARPWDKYSKITYANCSMDASISTKAYGDTTDKKNARFEVMSSVKPTDSTVKFAEYNNTGEGAITTAVAGGSILSEEEFTTLKNNADSFFYD